MAFYSALAAVVKWKWWSVGHNTIFCSVKGGDILEEKRKYIIGIDPDLTNQSLAVIDPQGLTRVIFDKVESPPKGSVDMTALKLARATEVIRKVVDVVFSWGVRAEDLHVFIEDQNVAHAKREQKINIQDLVTLAHVSGIWSGMLSALLWVPHRNIHIVKAMTWKQQQTKWINQRRTLTALGLEYKAMGGTDPKKMYPAPTSDLSGMLRYSLSKPNPGDFKDISDSLGIALWGHKQVSKEVIRKKQHFAGNRA